MPIYLIKPSAKQSRAVERECEYCKVVFYASPACVKFGGARFCSQPCLFSFNTGKNSFNYKPRLLRKCKSCKVKYEIEAWRLNESNRGKFCNNECMYKFARGENAFNWKGGVTPINKRARSCKPVLEWRKKVLLRDGNMCVKCGSTQNLEVDHIKPFAKYPELRAEVSNGRTLCRICHIKTFSKVSS